MKPLRIKSIDELRSIGKSIPKIVYIERKSGLPIKFRVPKLRRLKI